MRFKGSTSPTERQRAHDRTQAACALLTRLIAAAALLFAGLGQVHAATAFAETGFSETEVLRPDGAATWNEAVGITFSASGRMFVWERPGRVWIVDADNPVPQPFLDISAEVLSWRDHGMLGFALDPAFELNGHVYLLYAVDPHHLFHCDSPAAGAAQCGAGYSATTTWIAGDPDSPGHRKATIGRVTRYTAIKPPGDADFRRAVQIDHATRRVLLGETLRDQPKSTGIPLLYEAHGVGALLFGDDGSLLVSAGDSASYLSPDIGSASETYYQAALADGIIRPAENVGALRAQLVDSHNGKILRIHPATGDGYSSNPFYDSSAPRAARSRVWARGLRNAYRMALRPDSGSHSPAQGNPGVILVGDVGYDSREEVDVVDAPGGNFGWPLYEGLTAASYGSAPTVANRDAPNPLYGSSGCTLQYFRFGDLLGQDQFTPVVLNNPCNQAQPIPAGANPSRHMRPALEWPHEAASPARWAAYAADGSALALPLGSAAPGGAVVTGSSFHGSSVTGGMVFDGEGFPDEYHDRFFFGDYGGQWIRTLDFDQYNQLLAVHPFASAAGGIVAFGSNHHRQGFYYVAWTAFVRHVTYAAPGGGPPVASATGTPLTGASPLTVSFSSAGSSDPEGGALTYEWDFGDGASSTAANPQHVYTASSGVPVNFTATLTVRDPQGLQAQQAVRIALNNTPPSARITSPLGGSTYPVPGTTFNVQLRAEVSDAQSPIGSLVCQWQTVLYHNEHEHSDPFIAGCETQTTISPIGCTGQQYSFGFRLTVTDPQGLTARDEVRVHPDCGGPPADVTPPTAPSALSADAEGTTRIRLAWNAASDSGSGVAGYRVRRDGVDVGTTPAGTLSFTDSALTPNTAYTYTVVAFDNASPANVSAASAVTATTGSSVLRISAGSGAYTDSQGRVWAADAGFNTGQTSTFNQPIAGTVDDGLYQSERYDTAAAPDLEYAFTVPAGNYQVNLHFAENWANSAGARVFDVDMEGARRFEDIDIHAQAGWRTALVKSATLIVVDGQLNIRFGRQVGDPLINGIEIVRLGTVTDNTPPTVPTGLTATPLGTTRIGLTWNTATDAGFGVAGYRVLRDGAVVGSTAVGTLNWEDGALTPNTTYAYAVVAFDNATPANVSAPSAPVSASTASSVQRINAGGGAFTDSLGQLWAADAGFDSGNASVFNQPIAGTVEDPLYQSERYGSAAPPNLSYRIAVAPGNYLVRLHFAENWATWPGLRVFDVDIEGVRRFEDIDLYAQAGWRTALVRAVTLPVSDGMLDITLVRQSGDPLINAIEVIGPGPLVDSTPPTVPTGVTATTLSTTQIRVNWNAATDNGMGVGSYRVLRDGVPAGTTPASTLTWTDSGLTPDTTYSYTVVAVDGAAPPNASAPSSAVTARTLAPDTTAPGVPTGLTGAPLSTTQIRLAWNSSIDTGGSGLAGYRLQRDGVFVADIPAGTLSHTDGGLTPGTAYTYRVVAFDAATPPNVSVPSSPTVVATLAPDLTAPSVPAGLTATVLGTTQIRVAWNASSDVGTGVGGYRVLRDGVLVGTTSAGTLNYTDGALSAGTAYSYAVIAFDSASPANASVPSAPVTASTASLALRINAAGGAFTDSLGQVWAADSGFNTGLVSTFNQPIAGTVEDALYQSERYDSSSAPELQYSFTVPNGLYEVRLHFAENWATAPGARVFDVDIEGTRRFEDIDIFAQAGWRTALVKTANTFVLDGQLNIGFVHQADNPLINAIEIVGLGPVVDNTPPTVPGGLTAAALGTTQISLAWNASTDVNGTGVAGYRVLRNGVVVATTAASALGYVDIGLTANTSYTYTLVAFDFATPANASAPSAAVTAGTASSALRIDAGGSGFTDSLGQIWSADAGFNTGQTATFNQPIAGTLEDPLYHSERYDTSAAPDLEYDVAVAPGHYLVRLHFAENWATAAGMRVFDVDIENVRRFEDVDAYAQAGWRTALVRSATLIVTDGQLNIRFVRQAGDPLINAIEVIGLGPLVDQTPPTVPAGLAATPLNTAHVRLDWNASTDTDGMGVAGYRVLRNGVVVGTTNAATLSYTDTGLTADTPYSYAVLAFDGATPSNASAPSSAVATRTLAPDFTAPTVPAGLSAAALSDTQIRVSWAASTDSGLGVGGYRVLRNGVTAGTVAAITLGYTDSGLAPGTAYAYSVVAFDNALPANVSAPSAQVTGSTASTVVRIRAGGGAYADAHGQLWGADAGFNTGQTATFNQPIAGTEEDALYQSERYDTSSSPDLEYAIAVPVASYLVRLHFAENWATAAGMRVFDVDIEGARRFEDVDVFAQAGWRTALVKTASLAVVDGQLNIRFARQAGDPLVNAIEIIGLGPVIDHTPPTVPNGLNAAALSPTQMRISWNASTDVEGMGVAGYRVLRDGVQVGTTNAGTLGFTDGGLTPNTAYTWTVLAFDNATPANVSGLSAPVTATAPTLLIRVNTGGASFTDSFGQVWAADSGFNTGTISTFNEPIAGTVDDLLYQTERWDPYAAPELQYGFTVPNGNYMVRLHFAENWATSPGARVFDVDIEGVRRFEDIDIHAQAGFRTALVKTTSAFVADNQLTIRFVRQTENPLVDGIEIIGLEPLPDSVAPTAPAGLTATPISSAHIRLAWTAATDVGGTGVAGYRVLRNGVVVGSTGVGALTWIDSGLAPSTPYTYTVTAFDYASPVNVSAQSAPAAGTTLPPEPPDITSPTAPPHSSGMVNRYPQSYLHVDGTRLVTAGGQVVNLRGLNIGGWLVTENWMNGFSDWSDQGGIQPGRSGIQTLEERFGEAGARELLKAWEDNWITTQDLDRIRDAGFNLIRVPFSYRTLQNANGSWILDDTGRIDFSRMDWIVREAAARGIFTIFDLHIWPGQRQDYEGIGRPGNESVRAAMAELWKVVAAHYRGNGSVAAFDVINELPGHYGVHQLLTNAIRQGDPARVVVIEGFNYGDWRSQYDQGAFPNSLFSIHFYDFWGDPAVSTWDFQNRLQQVSSSPVPLYIGEFLADDFVAVARHMNANGIHWSPWTYKTVGMGQWGLFNYTPSLRTDLRNDSFEAIRARWANDLTSGQAPGATPNFTINPYLRNDEPGGSP